VVGSIQLEMHLTFAKVEAVGDNYEDIKGINVFPS
jgi:hypothetical protein